MNSENKNILLPTLTNDTLVVRPIRAEDFEDLYTVASDPEIWALHSERDRYQRPVFKKFFDKMTNPPAALVVLERSSGKIIGSSRYYDYNPEKRQIVVGYTFLSRAHWGGKTNATLKKLMLDHGFSFADTILFHTSAGNLRSQHALAKLGATRREGIVTLPGVGERVEYVLTKEQWEK